MKSIFLFGLLLLTSLLTGCASYDSPSADAGKPHETCLVCKLNHDLACIDVAVDSTTPTYMFNGQKYYFCSDDCKEHFSREPQKYVSN